MSKTTCMACMCMSSTCILKAPALPLVPARILVANVLSSAKGTDLASDAIPPCAYRVQAQHAKCPAHAECRLSMMPAVHRHAQLIVELAGGAVTLLLRVIACHAHDGRLSSSSRPLTITTTRETQQQQCQDAQASLLQV